jgi:beta-glucosidase
VAGPDEGSREGFDDFLSRIVTGQVSDDELLSFFVAMLGQQRANNDPPVAVSRSGQLRREDDSLAPAQVGPSWAPWRVQDMPRADTATDSLPTWFWQLDTNRTGQIAFHQWVGSGRSVDDFQRMDRNQDGFLTGDEVRRYLAQTPSQTNQRAVSQADHHEEWTSRVGQARDAPSNAETEPNWPHVRWSFSTGVIRRPESPGSALPARHPSAGSAATRGATPAAAAPPPLAATPIPVDDGTRAYWAMREAQNEVRAQLGPASVLFLGDSITDNFQNGSGLPVWTRYFAPLGAADFAVGGITTSQVLWQVQSGQVAAVAPDVVVLMIGTNNLGLGQSPADTATGIAAIVSAIGARLPQTRILMLGVLPRGQSPDDPLRAEVTKVNARIARFADGQRVHYLNIGAAFLQADGTIAPQLMPDFLHPSLAGYRIYAASIWHPLMALLDGQ